MVTRSPPGIGAASPADALPEGDRLWPHFWLDLHAAEGHRPAAAARRAARARRRRPPARWCACGPWAVAAGGGGVGAAGRGVLPGGRAAGLGWLGSKEGGEVQQEDGGERPVETVDMWRLWTANANDTAITSSFSPCSMRKSFLRCFEMASKSTVGSKTEVLPSGLAPLKA